MKTARIVRRLANNVNNARRPARKQQHILARNHVCEPLGLIDKRVAGLEPRALSSSRTHHSNFSLHSYSIDW